MPQMRRRDARAYATDLANYKAWCDKHGFIATPAMPQVVGAYLAAAGEGYAMPTLRRRVAAIARAGGIAGHPLDTKHPAIRETLRGIGRKHGSPPRRAAALTTMEVRKLSRACGTGLAGTRDRALMLLGFAGALRRSKLVGLDVEHATWTDDGLRPIVERSKMDQQARAPKSPSRAVGATTPAQSRPWGPGWNCLKSLPARYFVRSIVVVSSRLPG
jgi:integrase